MVKKRKGNEMKYLGLLLLFFAFTSQADDSPYCLTKAHLARDMASQILQGLDPSKINFAFPNVRSPEEAKKAQEFADKLMAEVLEMIQTEDDTRVIYETVKAKCNESISDAI
jgi:hypothetical protein